VEHPGGYEGRKNVWLRAEVVCEPEKRKYVGMLEVPPGQILTPKSLQIVVVRFGAAGRATDAL